MASSKFETTILLALSAHVKRITAAKARDIRLHTLLTAPLEAVHLTAVA